MKPYRIPQLAKPYTDYDMIQRHTELPPISDARGSLLYIFLNNGAASPTQHAELYTLVTELVQLALDTHESIDRKDGPGGDHMRTRQLKVLAGDYFSSWFYRLLAAQNEVEMVGTLSRAIADFNVMKAQMFVKARDLMFTAEQYWRHTVQLNMRLFLSFTPMIRESLQESWSSLLHEFTCCETVMLELRRGEEASQALDGYCYFHLLEIGNEDEKALLRERRVDDKDWKKLKMKYKCDSLLRDKLHESVRCIKDLLQGVKDENLIRELSSALERFQGQWKWSGQAAGEA